MSDALLTVIIASGTTLIGSVLTVLFVTSRQARAVTLTSEADSEKTQVETALRLRDQMERDLTIARQEVAKLRAEINDLRTQQNIDRDAAKTENDKLRAEVAMQRGEMSALLRKYERLMTVAQALLQQLEEAKMRPDVHPTVLSDLNLIL